MAAPRGVSLPPNTVLGDDGNVYDGHGKIVGRVRAGSTAPPPQPQPRPPATAPVVAVPTAQPPPPKQQANGLPPGVSPAASIPAGVQLPAGATLGRFENRLFHFCKHCFYSGSDGNVYNQQGKVLGRVQMAALPPGVTPVAPPKGVSLPAGSIVRNAEKCADLTAFERCVCSSAQTETCTTTKAKSSVACKRRKLVSQAARQLSLLIVMFCRSH